MFYQASQFIYVGGNKSRLRYLQDQFWLNLIRWNLQPDVYFNLEIINNVVAYVTNMLDQNFKICNKM